MPRRLILLGAAAVVLTVGVVLWLTVLSGSRTVTLTADGVQVSFERAAFADGAEPTLSTGSVDDEFVEVFGVPGPGPDTVMASLRAASDPVAPVEIAFDVFLESLPDEAAPAVFYRDEEVGRWLPVPTVIEDGRVVGTGHRAGDYVPAVLTAVPEVWRGIQWLRFQVGIEPVEPRCSGDAPAWLLGVTTVDERAVRACAESGDDAELVLRVAPGRPYALAFQPPAGGGGTVTAAPGAESVLTWAVGELPAGTVTLDAAPTAASALHDTVLAGAAVLAELAGDTSDQLLRLDGCVQQAGADPDLAIGCLDPFAEAGGAAAERVVTGIRTGVTLETAGRPAPAAAAALQSPGEVVLELANVLDPPPDGATMLHEALAGWQGGPSGNRVAVLIGDVFAADATTQWVGCEDSPAAAYYTVAGHTRFTGTLGARDYMPDDIVAEVRLLVDDSVITEFEAGTEPVDVDVELPPGDLLVVEAHRIAGECGLAPDGYLVWGNGALSGQ